MPLRLDARIRGCECFDRYYNVNENKNSIVISKCANSRPRTIYMISKPMQENLDYSVVTTARPLPQP